MENEMIGKYVIVRCRDAGVHSGYLKSYQGRECVLTDARRLWKWVTKETSGDFLNGVAVNGLHEDSKVGEPVTTIILTENCEIIECSRGAAEGIRSYPVHSPPRS